MVSQNSRRVSNENGGLISPGLKSQKVSEASAWCPQEIPPRRWWALKFLQRQVIAGWRRRMREWAWNAMKINASTAESLWRQPAAAGLVSWFTSVHTHTGRNLRFWQGSAAQWQRLSRAHPPIRPQWQICCFDQPERRIYLPISWRICVSINDASR